MAQLTVLRTLETVVVRAAAGAATIVLTDPPIVRIKLEGVGYEDFVPVLTEELDRLGAPPSLLAFDAWELSSYETGFRKLWTAWLEHNRPETILCLLESRVVAMGIKLTNLVLGGTIQSFSSRLPFERAIELSRTRASAHYG